MKPDLYHLIATAIRVPDGHITADTSMAATPEWDSLSHMELIVSLEEQFQVNLDGDEIVMMTSVREIERLLKAKGVLAT